MLPSRRAASRRLPLRKTTAASFVLFRRAATVNTNSTPTWAPVISPCGENPWFTVSRQLPQHFGLGGVCVSMRLRLVIYALASLVLLAFHAPAKALVSLLSDYREF